MRFVTFLNSGGSPQAAAVTECVELVEKSAEAGQLCPELAAEFISECLRAIGFNCAITAQQLEDEELSIAWPPEVNIYVFPYSSLQFAPFEKFLVRFCAAVQQETTVQQLARAQTATDEEELVIPLDLLMQLMAHWCKVYRQLPSSYFEEPLARINFQMFRGMHRLRLIHRAEYPLLDRICTRLYRSALQGLFYCQSHDTVATGLLNTFEKNYEFFYQHAHGYFELYFELFSVKNMKPTYRLAFESLQKLLQLTERSPQTILTDFLIERRMQQVYFATLKEEKTKRLLLAALNFLKALQSKLIDVSCLAQPIVTSIQATVLNSDPCISSLAAELYIAIMQRQLADEKSILKHILEFFLRRMSTTEFLPLYVRNFWPHFPYMQTIDVYLEIITNDSTETIMRFLCAQFLKTVYKEMQHKIDYYQKYIVHMLELLPELIVKVADRCLKTSGILLEIFVSSDLQLLQRKLPSFMSLIDGFEKYAIQAFTHATNYEYPLLLCLLMQIKRCINYTGKLDRLEQSGAVICSEYFRIEKKLEQLSGEQPNAEMLREYRTVLQKVNVLLKVDYDLIGSFLKLCKTLKIRLIDTAQIYEFIKENDNFLDIYAIGILTSGIIKLASNSFAAHEIATEKRAMVANAPQLAEHLRRNLRKFLEMSPLPAVRIAAMFVNLIDLYYAFPAKSTICSVTLATNDYHLLVETLLQLNFSPTSSTRTSAHRALKMDDGGDEETQQHPKWIHDYQSLMLRKFTQLHTCKPIDINSKLSWKVCIFYGLPQHQFSVELEELLLILATHRFKIYRHICAVLIFNLYKRQPALPDRKILTAVKAHNNFIEKLTTADDTATPPQNRALLKVHIVLSVLTIIEKSLELSRITDDQNRLLAVKHLRIFIEGLNLSQQNVLPDIIGKANALRKHLLSAAEIRLLDMFLEFCNQHQS